MKANEIVIINNLDIGILTNLLKDASRIGVIVDENTRKYCLPHLTDAIKSAFQIIEIPSGEKNKNLDTCIHVWEKLVELQFDRNSILILLGGGVLGDLGGFCSSTYMRGIRFVHVPTTLLAMVDSSIGNKLGIDFKGYKNMIGCFTPPESIFIYPKFLQTLPRRQMINGIAEVIKYGLIQDYHIIELIKNSESIDDINYNEIIALSSSIKTKIVLSDPFEKGLRKILNFGHTIGHAVESVALNQQELFLHGESIAIGMICEAYISMKKGMIEESYFLEMEKLILKYFDHHPGKVKEISLLLEKMQHDKKNQKGRILMSLLNGIGSCAFNIEVTNDEIKESLIRYKNLTHAI